VLCTIYAEGHKQAVYAKCFYALGQYYAECRGATRWVNEGIESKLGKSIRARLINIR
jgi:hypothetical protein